MRNALTSSVADLGIEAEHQLLLEGRALSRPKF